VAAVPRLGVAAFAASAGAIATLLWAVFAASTIHQPLNAPELFAYATGIGSSASVLACAAALVARPRHSTVLGALIALFSLLGVFGYFGGFCLGPALGVTGGLLAVSEPGTAPRPAESAGAAVLCAMGAYFITLGAVFGTFGPYPFLRSPLPEVVIGALAGISLIVGGILQYADPRTTWASAVLVLAASAASYFGAYAGFLGGVFGVPAGLLMLLRRYER